MLLHDIINVLFLVHGISSMHWNPQKIIQIYRDDKTKNLVESVNSKIFSYLIIKIYLHSGLENFILELPSLIDILLF